MIIGFPGEGIEEIRKTVDLAIKLYRENSKAWFPFNIFTPFPGTPMFKLAQSYGFRAPEKLEEWSKLESVGWDQFYGHWMTEKDNKIFRSINCTSYLAFPAAVQKISNPFLRVLFRIYQPFAYLRFKHMFYFLHFEKFFMEEKEGNTL